MDSQLKPSGMSILQRVLKSGSAKILWDFSVQTDHKLENNKPDNYCPRDKRMPYN